jgi:hypothetical protein
LLLIRTARKKGGKASMEGIFFAGPGALMVKLLDEAAFAHDVLSDMAAICGAFSGGYA